MQRAANELNLEYSKISDLTSQRDLDYCEAKIDCIWASNFEDLAFDDWELP